MWTSWTNPLPTRKPFRTALPRENSSIYTHNYRVSHPNIVPEVQHCSGYLVPVSHAKAHSKDMTTNHRDAYRCQKRRKKTKTLLIMVLPQIDGDGVVYPVVENTSPMYVVCAMAEGYESHIYGIVNFVLTRQYNRQPDHSLRVVRNRWMRPTY